MEDVNVWLRNFIMDFRKEAEKLSQEEISKISNLDNFFPPCQILILWFKDANYQFLMCTHDNNENDVEIEIEGPMPTYEAIDRMGAILKNPKWNRELTEEEKKLYYQTTKFSEILETIFLYVIQTLRGRQFQKPPATSHAEMKVSLFPRSFFWHIAGNIIDIDKAKIITEIIQEAKRAVATTKMEPTKTESSPPTEPQISSCATLFYPHIWVGRLPVKTFREKAFHSYIFPEKAFDLKYKDRVMVINKDGLIAIGEKDAQKATRMLNEIMATLLLMGFEANAVRELDIGDAKIDSGSLSIVSWGIKMQTPRSQLAYFSFEERLGLEERTEIEKDDLMRLIRQAERISQDPDISDFLTFLLEAHTHLENSEYSQSFIMSWVIVERQMYWLWKKFLKEEQMSRDRRDKLTNPVYWTIDFVLEGLNLGGQLPDKEYEELMFLKNKRNDIIHAGERVTLEETEKCFKLARSIVKQRSGLD